MQGMIRSIVREPLFHFFLLGIAVFLAYNFLGTRSDEELPDKIVVTQAKVNHLVTTYKRTWNRLPTQEELQDLIREHVREEVCVREAITLGMDREDTVIRRRLRQKMEFLFEDIASQVKPAESDLQAYLDSYPDKFRKEAEFTFHQIYFNPEKHPQTLDVDIKKLLIDLDQPNTQVDLNTLGDSSLMERTFESVSEQDMKSQFGDKFAEKLLTAPVRKWHGPVESGYGMHLVFVINRSDGTLPALEEIREDVSREWSNARREEMNEKSYAEMLKRYDVTIESVKIAENP